jgi:hypothetical protein
MPVPSKRKRPFIRYHCAALTHWSVRFPLFIGAGLATARLASFRKMVDAGFEHRDAVALRVGRTSASHRAELQ